MQRIFYWRLQVWVTRSQNDISERDEEILRNEIDPIYGWKIHHIILHLT